MMRAMLSLVAMISLADCSRADHATRVVNRSSAPVTVTYVEARDGLTRSVDVAAGETRTLAPNRAFADLADLRLFADGRGFVWSDWTSMRGRLLCAGDCTITWFPGHRISLSGPMSTPPRERYVGPPPLFAPGSNPSVYPARGGR
ncbi:MAG: hypothetical protein V4475_07890 [Pseudomonadota bacterium]